VPRKPEGREVILSDPVKYQWMAISDAGQITPCPERHTVAQVLQAMRHEAGLDAHLDPRGFLTGSMPGGGRLECHVVQ
jgi:hypothetical protein